MSPPDRSSRHQNGEIPAVALPEPAEIARRLRHHQSVHVNRLWLYPCRAEAVIELSAGLDSPDQVAALATAVRTLGLRSIRFTIRSSPAFAEFLR